jgi:condensin complex subunit 1
MVLTHLILNDMVKVKGQVCEIALCLRDQDQRIQDTSRLLFHELSKRSNNPVYNLLPDIISQLSHAEISKEDFRAILSFLLGYIKKDRQADMLLEKLFQRLPKCSSLSQVADITYCMTQLKVNEKSIKTLSDNYKYYKDALVDGEVKKHVTTLLTKAKKSISNGKAESKQAVEELETRIEKATEIALQDQLADDHAVMAKAKAGKRTNRRPMQLIVEDNDDSQEEESFDDDEEELDLEADEDEAGKADKENKISSSISPAEEKICPGPKTIGRRRIDRRCQNRVS